MAKLTKEQQAIDNELRRINRQIQQAAKIYGTESQLFKQYNTLLSSKGLQHASPASLDYVRENKAGLPQLKRDKETIEFIQKGVGARGIMQLGRLPTVQSYTEALVKNYQSRTGQKVKKRSEIRQAAIEEARNYSGLSERLNNVLSSVYKLQKESGVIYKGIEEIKNKSKGYWTSGETLQEMIDIAEEIVSGENRKAVEQADKFLGW